MEFARERGIICEMLIVDDDITFKSEDKEGDFNLKRGLCGTVLLYKILGQLSRDGVSYLFLLNLDMIL